MQPDALTIITTIAVLLFIGLVCSWLATKLKIPDVLLLILAGMAFGHATFRGQPLVEFPEIFLTGMAILALAMIVFDSTARLRLREFDVFSVKALKLTVTSVFFTLVLFTLATHYLLKLPMWLSILFATLMSGTSPDVLLPLRIAKSRVISLLKLESIFNTPLTVILPFIVIDLMQGVKTELVSEIVEQLVPFVMKFIVGIGAGVFVGIILFKLVQKVYTEVYSPLAVIIAALLAFVLAENLGGSGVLSVTALGLFFGNVYVKEKPALLTIESVLTKALFIFVFILAGLIIKIPITKEFFLTSGLLFGAYILIRFLAVLISTRRENYSLGEKLFATLNVPKGIATVAVVFMLALYNIEGIALILDLTLAFVLYSIIISSIVASVSRVFVKR